MADKYTIIINSKALSDLSECVSFVLRVSKEAAIKLKDDVFSSIESLSIFPEKNPIFEMPKSFPFVMRKQIINDRYIVLYSIEEDKVIVYRILDSRRKFNHLLH